MNTNQSEAKTDPLIDQVLQEFEGKINPKTEREIRAITLLQERSCRVTNQELFQENLILRKKCNELVLEVLKLGLRRSSFRYM
jgi:hypothetical protein